MATLRFSGGKARATAPNTIGKLMHDTAVPTRRPAEKVNSAPVVEPDMSTRPRT
jgi:hypothetical protein